MGFAGDHRGARIGLGGDDRGVDRHRIMPVDRLNVPARGLEAGDLVGLVGNIHGAVDGDVVVVPKDDEVRQLLHPRKADGLLAHAFHEAAVAGHHIGEVVDDLGAIAGTLVFLGHGKAHSVGDALAERAGRGFDAAGMAVFGVAGGAGAPLAEVLDLLERDVGIAGEVKERVDQHRAVTGREDEPVAVRPVRRFGIKAQVLFKKHGRHIGHAHRHPRVARVGGGNGVEGKGADRGRFHPVVGVGGTQRCNIQGKCPLWSGYVLPASYQPRA